MSRIKLYGFGKYFGVADPSPFVLKIDAYLRITGIDFDYVSGFDNYKRAPKGKLPYIEDEGVLIPDSFFILTYLKETFGDSLDANLTDEQKAISQLVIKSLDENFYWCIVYSRWLHPDTWPTIKETFFGKMPFPIKQIAPAVAKKGVATSFVKHGMGKHSDAEIMGIAENTLESLSTMLSDKNYFFGDTPTTLDAVAFAFLAQVTIVSLDTPLNQLARKFDNLVSYCERINSAYYSS